MVLALPSAAALPAAASLHSGGHCSGIVRKPAPPPAAPPLAGRRPAAGALALAAAAVAARGRAREGRPVGCAAARRPAAEVVDVEDQSGDSAALLKAVLEKAASEGVPLWNRPMEYIARPQKSPLPRCGIPALEAAEDPVQTLVVALRAAGVEEDRAEVGAAALCLMLGGVDEAHNLVTPHSWAAPTTFGGQPKPGSKARTEASYCHVLVHRMEGMHLGEFGTGFNNSGYWINQAFTGNGHAIFPALRAAVEDLAVGCEDARPLLRSMGPQWDPRAFSRFCKEALEFEEEGSLEFCKAVQACELRLLFEHITGFGSEDAE